MTSEELEECRKEYRIFIVSLYGPNANHVSEDLWLAFRNGYLKGKQK